MMATDDLLQREASRRRAAGEILGRLQVMERWSELGVPRLVGAAAYGLMVAPDIDIEIYCDAPTVDAGFAIVGQLASQPAIWKVRFSNELHRPAQGLYWQLRYRADDGEVWHIDMWLLAHDHPGPRSVDLVGPMKRALTEETRTAILRLKEALLNQSDVHSIEIYEAVLDGGVRSVSDFRVWLSQRKPVGLTFWRPKTRR